MKKVSILLILSIFFIVSTNAQARIKETKLIKDDLFDNEKIVTVTNHRIPENKLKVLKLESIDILGLISFGNVGVHRAVKENNIEKIKGIDVNSINILGLPLKKEVKIYYE